MGLDMIPSRTEDYEDSYGCPIETWCKPFRSQENLCKRITGSSFRVRWTSPEEVAKIYAQLHEFKQAYERKYPSACTKEEKDQDVGKERLSLSTQLLALKEEITEKKAMLSQLEQEIEEAKRNLALIKSGSQEQKKEETKEEKEPTEQEEEEPVFHNHISHQWQTTEEILTDGSDYEHVLAFEEEFLPVYRFYSKCYAHGLGVIASF